MENFSKQKRSVDLLKSNDSKPFKEIFLRFLWALFSCIPFSLPGRYLSGLRIALLRLFGAKIGEKVLICSGVHVWFPWYLSIGECSAIGRSVELYNYANIYIGSHTVISQYSYICTASHDYLSESMDFFAKSITIGDYVWVAAGAMICPGVTVSSGAVVGAKSLVASDLDEWSIYAGVPARKIRDRILK